MANNERKDIAIEDMVKNIEEKITNNEYYEDVTIEYKDCNLHCRLRPISQAKFVKITNDRKKMESAEFNTLVVAEGLINKYDNKPFKKTQIEELFDGGLVSLLAIKIMEMSGITQSAEKMQKLQNF